MWYDKILNSGVFTLCVIIILILAYLLGIFIASALGLAGL